MQRSSLLTLAVIALFAPAAIRAAEITYETIDDLGFSPSPQAAEQLIGCLGSDDPQQRWRAARALGNLRHKPAAEKLAGLLADQDPVVQVHAMIALTRIGDASPAVVDAIMMKVGSPDERVARTALQTLKRLRPGPEKLATALEHALETDEQSVMVHAVEALVEAGGAAAPLLEKALANEKSAYLAALAISEIGAPCAETANELAELLLRTQDPHVQHQTLLALAAIGGAAHGAAPAVQKLAAETDIAPLRVAACYTLGMLDDSTSTDLLRRLSTEGGEFQQMVATWSIAKLHPDDPHAQQAALTKLTQGLKSSQADLRDAAAIGLSRLDAPSEKVAPAMMAALSHADGAQKSNIAAALASLGADKVLDWAIAALDKPEFADVAIEVIGRLGPDAGPAADALAARLEGASPEQATRIQFALGAIGPAAAGAAPAVAERLSSDDATVRQSALFALRQIGASDGAANDNVAAFLEATDDRFEKLAAAWALAAMGPSGEQLSLAIDALRSGLSAPEAQTRLETINAIASLGAAGEPLMPDLERLAKSDPNADVREAAAEVAR